jgi:hypothetical protein
MTIHDQELRQPASLAEVLRWIADGMEILPEPLGIRCGQADPINIHVHTMADWDSWRRRLGAPMVEPGQWKEYSGGGMHRRFVTTAEWRGRLIELLMIETRATPETKAERRERLLAELAELDRRVEAQVPA